ncbi:molybdate ABC transporter substrate-binding protein [Rhodococcus sp. IEGM 1379]|uniref:molybdate ABC transporter substrate-binding protein n=1 Tax=Rhodococcus sp. IEGM 1379 TaxID=3047086 RepID=UPI0024B6F9A4|nr:molybdate ABC transporter substrate-binding protein [Rhodococcus sp. IEGM 1379]MDI9914900.1 molybdate ABC transporter substrate-binding protein [Rhodococcus sp. IEGM 1379]
MKRILGIVAAGVLSLALVTGCSSPDSSTKSTSTRATGNITVFAAASLKGTFTELGKEFESENPGTKVTFSFAGSSDLVAQIIAGAPADVFASADAANMKKATDAGVVEGTPSDFASNTLAIVVPPGNPKGINTFNDLAQGGTQVVICAPQVPCGAATKKVEDATGQTLKPVSEESSVTDVLNKVTSGQADAGIVYVTDAKSAGDKVETIAFPEAATVVNLYQIAVLKDSKNASTATKFVDLVKGSKGLAVLSDAGFAAP